MSPRVRGDEDSSSLRRGNCHVQLGRSELTGRREELRIDRVADDRGGLEEPACRRPEPLDVGVDEFGQVDGWCAAAEHTCVGHSRGAGLREMPTELADEQRIAGSGSMYFVEQRDTDVAGAVGPQRERDLAGRQTAEPDEQGAVARALAGEHCSHVGRLEGSAAHRGDHAQAGNARDEVLEQPGTRSVGPVEIVDQQEEVVFCGQLAHRSRGGTEHVDRCPRVPDVNISRREQVNDLAGELAVAARRPGCGAVGAERVDEHTVRRRGAIVARAKEHHVAASVGARGRFARDPALADSRGADHRDEPRSGVGCTERVDLVQLAGASDHGSTAGVGDRRWELRGHRCRRLFGRTQGIMQQCFCIG